MPTSNLKKKKEGLYVTSFPNVELLLVVQFFGAASTGTEYLSIFVSGFGNRRHQFVSVTVTGSNFGYTICFRYQPLVTTIQRTVQIVARREHGLFKEWLCMFEVFK